MRKVAVLRPLNCRTCFAKRHPPSFLDRKHRATPIAQLINDQDLSDELEIQRRGDLVEQQTRGSIINARAMATRYCWPPES